MIGNTKNEFKKVCKTKNIVVKMIAVCAILGVPISLAPWANELRDAWKMMFMIIRCKQRVA